MDCYRIDESGYTGFDLLNRDQRFQGAAAIAIENDDAERLIKEYFPRLQATELKYAALSRRPGNHPRLLRLLTALLHNYRSVTYVCEKRFLLILMFCDYAVEPWYYERDFNFYAEGQNYGMASLIAKVGPTLFGKAEFEAMLIAFQLAVKEKTPQALADLVAAVRHLRWYELPEAFGPLARDAAPECLAAIATPGVDTDIAIVVLQSLISRMEAMSKEPYRVEHDKSKNLERYHDLLQRFVAHEGSIELRQTAIASFKFPLKLTAVTQVDSKASAAVQLADVMVGAALEAANRFAGLKAGGLDPDAVMALYKDGQFIHLIPDIDFEGQRHFRQGTQAAEVIDYFAQHFAAKP